MPTSRKYKGQRIVVWPLFLDSGLTRGEGRRIPLSKAVPHPSIRELEEAAKRLDLDPLVEEKAYPKDWMRYRKRVVVLKKWGRQETLVRLADEIRKMRAQKKH